MTTDITAVKEAALVRICDDDTDLAAALELYLTLEGWKTAVYHDAKSFLTGDRPSVPGCLILDVRMPGLTGIECQRVMKEHGVDLPVIFITGHGDIDMAVQAVLEGAVDFIQKPVDEERLLKDITKACERSVQKVTGSVSADTARERLAAFVSREIAERLGIALRTVEVHRASALKKIGTHDPAVIRRILVAAGA